jgi:hypothetical protein
VFENRVLRKIFGPKRDEIRGNWSKLYSEEFYDLHSTVITWVTKPMRKRWEMHVARTGRGEVHTGFQ